MSVAFVEAWVEEPVRRFVADARVVLALLLYPSGQVLAQHGFVRAVDVMATCALAAAIRASSGELGRQLDGKPFTGLHHPGRQRQIFIAEANTHRGPYIFLTVFGEESSLGLVQLYFKELEQGLAAAAPVARKQEAVLATDFEGELNRNLAALFRTT